MKTLSRLQDGRILATNYLVETTLGEYLAIAETILNNNEYQRKRVKSSLTIYALLKKDFLAGCVIPPIVLALSKDESEAAPDFKLSLDVIRANSGDLVILDGLQRTLTLQDLVAETKSAGDSAAYNELLARPLRLEIYVGLNRLGVLYRMLTLNTGQSPMSLRQQIEMLYLDYSRTNIDGVRLIREVDDDATTALGEYSFKSMIEGFNSYLERNELPIDRYDLLESIKGLEKLSQEDAKANLFVDFVKTYNRFVEKLHTETSSHEFLADDLEIKGQPFGRDVRRIFVKSQAMTGFGAAIGKLRDFGAVSGFEDVAHSIESLVDLDSVDEDVAKLLQFLEKIRLSSKKIGNSQRLFFHYFFRELFNPTGDAFRSIGKSVDEAYSRYETQVM